MDFDVLRADRLKFLNALYEITEANRHRYFLSGEGLLEHRALGGIIGITHRGIKEVEEARSAPDQETHLFPPVNFISIENMVNSSIQQASPEAIQNLHVGDPRTDQILDAVNQVKSALDTLGLRETERADLEAEIGTVESQLKSSRPKAGVLQESLGTMRSILESAGGSGLANMIGMVLGGG